MLSFLPFGLPAQKIQPSTNDSIVFENTVHNFGTLKYKSDASCEFKFTNKGKLPLVLNQVHPVCGCTEAEWPKDSIAAGGIGIIKVSYNTQLVGKFSKAITVHSNAVNTLVILVVEGEVMKKE